MAIRAPWKGWVKVAMPVVSALILANTIAILTLSVFNTAALQLSYEDAPEYVENHGMLVRAQLVFFWCTIPTVYLVVTSAEIFSLWTDRLRPVWVLVSSSGAICVWVMQIILWQFCVQPVGSSAPGYCPYVYRGEGWGRFPSWYTATSKAPVQAVPTLFVLYLAQLAFAAKIYHRQRRCSFRRSDMSQTWLRKPEDEEEGSEMASRSERTSEITVTPTSSWPFSFHASQYRETLSAGPKRPPASPVPKSGSPVSLQASECDAFRLPVSPLPVTRSGSPFSFDASSSEEEERLSMGSSRLLPTAVPPIREMRPTRRMSE